MKYFIKIIDTMIKLIAPLVTIALFWTLIDNYEWLQGLDARFGLYRVDFKTLKRTPTSAASYYSYLIQSRSQM